ncbi:MAG: ATP-dependent DNA helicase RecG [bacterium]|nr:ATP-dependent DNA helicase RecG [bacterium]
MLRLETELAKINGIGQKFIDKLDKLKIKTVKDLLWHFPFRYDDFSTVAKIADLKVNQSATVRAVVKKVSTRRSWKKKMVIVEALVADETGGIKAIWFNQPFIAKALMPGRRVNFAGKVAMSNDEIFLQSPTYELFQNTTETMHTAGLIPVYPETRGLTSKGIRFLTGALLKNLESIPDFLPEEVLLQAEMPSVASALKNIHFPKKIEQAEKARERFAFADIFLIQLMNLRNRMLLAKEKAPPLNIDKSAITDFIARLPFELTGAQHRSIDEIVHDLAKPNPMNRLLQGDVGSGKTVVAAVAALMSAQNGKQTAFMAPTEVLARQHYRTLCAIFKNYPIGIGILTGSESRAFYGEGMESKLTRPKFLEEIAQDKIKIILGTHALISEVKGKKSLIFNDLALAIVDEQHRFGVDQRASLVKKESASRRTAGWRTGETTTVHFLSMSATPIPRTLSLTLFGDLDLSIIDEMPKGRKEIVTKVIPPLNRKKAYDFIRGEVKKGRQAFVICPRIEEAEKPEVAKVGDKKKINLWADVKNVTEEYERLSKTIFPDLRVAMLHGRMKGVEKAEIMADFAAGRTHLLVSTSVIEVGVDVPNASIMMIEGADRFGLAQLYQFRGRVGRGEHQSYCLLFTDSESASTAQRLDALIKAKNGFELAEQDLAIRGPGEFIGDKQTGIPDLAMRSLNNIAIIKLARASAEVLIKKDYTLSNYPPLKAELAKFQNKIHLE